MAQQAVSIRDSSILKPKKLTLAQQDWSLPAVEWSPNRKKPTFTPGIWGNDVEEELSKYVDWHRRHPHCVSPRKNGEEIGEITGRKVLDEENPNMYYYGNGLKVHPIPEEYHPTSLGIDCDIDEVSTIAMKQEAAVLISHFQDNDDPWYLLSVKDQLEQSHIDGSHTTVRTKVKREAELSDFNKKVAWQMEQYGDYEGGFPDIPPAFKDTLFSLSLQDKSLLFDKVKPKEKVGPWGNSYQFSKFTAGGTALDEFKKKDTEIAVTKAITKYLEEEIQEKERISVKISTKRSKKHSSNKEEPIVREEDPLETMKTKLGGEKSIEKLGDKLVHFAHNVSKYSKKDKAIVETKMDLAEACDKLRVVKVASLLAFGQGNANCCTAEDEPIFLHVFQRANKLDQVTNNLLPEQSHLETTDRKKMQKILDQLIKYNADINNKQGKESLAAAHMAAAIDNVKLISWLGDNEADLDIVSQFDLTPLMTAAKYGSVQALGELVKQGVNINLKNSEGRTALHIAGFYGQTRAALFLLRISIDRSIRDNNNKTAAQLAQENGFMSTSQAISAFAVMPKPVKPQIDFSMDVLRKNKEKNIQKNKFQEHFEFLNPTESLTQATSFLSQQIQQTYQFIRTFFSRGMKISPLFHKPGELDDEEHWDKADELIRKQQKQSQEGNTTSSHSDLNNNNNENDVLPFTEIN